MSHQDASVKSILFALLANFGIAVTKTVAAVITGSGSMEQIVKNINDCESGLKKNKPCHPVGLFRTGSESVMIRRICQVRPGHLKTVV